SGHGDRTVDHPVAVEDGGGGRGGHCFLCLLGGWVRDGGRVAAGSAGWQRGLAGGQCAIASRPSSAEERSSASISSTDRAATSASELFSVLAPVIRSMNRAGGTRHS